MVKTCIICKKQPVPFDRLRSFHKFPDNCDLKKKWMDAIGVSAICKSSMLCSEHFDDSAFHNTDGYTTIRRLIATAVPRNINNKNEPSAAIVRESHPNAPENINSEQSSASPTDLSENLHIDKKPSEATDAEKLTTIQSAVNNNQSRKRKSNIVDMLASRKRFKIGFRTEYFSRNDFTTDEAWARFVKLIHQERLQKQISHQKRKRVQRKLKSIEEVVMKLKEQDHFEAADYLQVHEPKCCCP